MIVSNSEVGTFLSCQRRHYWAFRERLAPLRKNQSVAITRGIVGHSALEAYYGHKKLGMFAKQECLGVALEQVDIAIENTPEFIKEFTQLKQLITRYVELYWDEPWRILEIESQYAYDLSLLDNSTVDEYGMRLDLLVEATGGPDKGKIIIVDHKFVYDFFSERDIELNPQMLKYVKTLRTEGINVTKAILNQVRYRPMKSNDPKFVFKRANVPVPVIMQEKVMQEHAKTAGRINQLKKLTEEEHKEQTLMHLEKGSCGYCSFLPLCLDELNGRDSNKTKKVLYQDNEYARIYDRT